MNYLNPSSGKKDIELMLRGNGTNHLATFYVFHRMPSVNQILAIVAMEANEYLSGR